MKKIKKTTARILVSVFVLFGSWLFIDQFFIKPIGQIFTKQPVTAVNIMIVILTYFIVITGIVLFVKLVIWAIEHA